MTDTALPLHSGPIRACATGLLYVVATPIGNLQDFSVRAQEVLRKVACIAAEDTRHSRRLLDAFSITTPLVALHEHNERQAGALLIARLLAGESIALISDAGTPVVSDPGVRFLAMAHQHAIAVIAIPGPSAQAAALSVAGFAADQFVFEGFLPAKASARRARLGELAQETRTLVFYEAPHRILDCVADMADCFGAHRQAALVKEISKLHETTQRGALAQLLDWLHACPQHCKGEFVVVTQGAPAQDADEQAVARTLAVLLAELPLKQAVDLAVQLTGGKKNELYRLAIAHNAQAQAVTAQ